MIQRANFILNVLVLMHLSSGVKSIQLQLIFFVAFIHCSILVAMQTWRIWQTRRRLFEEKLLFDHNAYDCVKIIFVYVEKFYEVC